MDIGVVIPAHPARIANRMLDRAVGSVWAQTLPAAELHVPVDTRGDGAWATRNRGLQAVRARWTAFLDSDDEMMPHHLASLAKMAASAEAEYVFSYYQVRNAYGVDLPVDPLGHFGEPFDPRAPHQTTITVLVRTELAQMIGFREPPASALINGQRYGEDFQFTLDCCAAGARIVHLPRRTWWWYHHGLNTSGLPDQGDAVQREGAAP